MGPKLLTKRLTAGRAGILFHEAPRAGGDEGGCMAGKPRYEGAKTQRQQKMRPNGPKHHCLRMVHRDFRFPRDEWPSRRLPVVRH